MIFINVNESDWDEYLISSFGVDLLHEALED